MMGDTEFDHSDYERLLPEEQPNDEELEQGILSIEYQRDNEQLFIIDSLSNEWYAVHRQPDKHDQCYHITPSDDIEAATAWLIEDEWMMVYVDENVDGFDYPDPPEGWNELIDSMIGDEGIDDDAFNEAMDQVGEAMEDAGYENDNW